MVPAPVIHSARRTLLGNVTLNWKSAGSCYYEVYRSDAENGNYTRVGQRLLTTYTDLTARYGKTYYYKLVAVPFSSRQTSSDLIAAAPMKIR